MFVNGLEEENNPTSITLSYFDRLVGDHLELKVEMMYNAVFLFASASNLEQIVFQYNDQHIEIDRESLEEWLGFPMNTSLSEKTFLKNVNKKLEAGFELPI